MEENIAKVIEVTRQTRQLEPNVDEEEIYTNEYIYPADMSLAKPIPSDVKRDLILPSDLVSGESTHGKNQPEDSPPSATTHCEALEESARYTRGFRFIGRSQITICPRTSEDVGKCEDD